MQTDSFIDAHRGKIGDVSIYGQEANHTTWQLAAMNMVIRGIDFNFGKQPASTYTNDQHPDLRADFVMANPPFNMKEWDTGVDENDQRWRIGNEQTTPPSGNANFAWLLHMLHHTAPNGSLAILLANGSMSSNTNNEGVIRQKLIEADLVECMVALPGQLFTNTQIPACIWFLTKNKGERTSAAGRQLKDRKGKVLFIDARNLGYMKDRVLRDFAQEDLNQVTETLHNWQEGNWNLNDDAVESTNSENDSGFSSDQPGFCKSAELDLLKKHDYVLTPGRYVGAAAEEYDDEPFAEKMARLTSTLKTQFEESGRLEAEIKKNLAGLGYEL